MKNLGLIPLRNFANVSGNLYRSAQPIYEYEYEWLKRKLGIKTIFNLRSESDHDKKIVTKIKGMKVITYPIPDHHAPTYKQAVDFMNRIKLNKEPILFHCEHGRGRTSTFCILALIAIGLTLKEAIKFEEKKYEYTLQHKEQIDFLKQFE